MRLKVVICLVVQLLLVLSVHGWQTNSRGYSSSSSTLPKDEGLTVCVSEGCLKGKLMRADESSFKAFLGVPYASPPTGNLRFKSPIYPERYRGNRDSTIYRDKCIQTNYQTRAIEGNEDCLYLNVFVPQNSSSSAMPVVVFLHGGSFKQGDASFYGPEYFMDTQQVIVVTLNYRLGVFGFLSTGDDTLRGNLGLKDQSMALQWIRRNIVNFGGDRDKVTLWGDSAGAASVHYQMMSARSNGLFQKAIMSGGNAFAYWALERNPQKQFRQFANLAGIDGANTKDTSVILEAMKRMSSSDLQRSSEKMYTFHPLISVFRPVIEGSGNEAIISEDPRSTWSRGLFQKRPFMAVVSPNEQGPYDDLYYDQNMQKRLKNDIDNSLIEVGEVTRHELPAIKDYYFGGNVNDRSLRNISMFMRDRLFHYPVVEMIEKYLPHQSAQHPMDLLKFSFTSSFSMTKLFHKYTQVNNGPSNMDYLLYLFRMKALDRQFYPGAAELSARAYMTGIWVEYIKNGLGRSEDYTECTPEHLQYSFCPYLVVSRANNAVELGVGYDFPRDNALVELLSRI